MTPATRLNCDKKTLPISTVRKNIFADLYPKFEPRSTNSKIVLKLGKLCFASKIKNGENVINAPAKERIKTRGHFLKFSLTKTISPATNAKIAAKKCSWIHIPKAAPANKK